MLRKKGSERHRPLCLCTQTGWRVLFQVVINQVFDGNLFALATFPAAACVLQSSSPLWGRKPHPMASYGEFLWIAFTGMLRGRRGHECVHACICPASCTFSLLGRKQHSHRLFCLVCVSGVKIQVHTRGSAVCMLCPCIQVYTGAC